LFHAVQITMTEDGRMSGRVLQAFASAGADARITFGDRRDPLPQDGHGGRCWVEPT